MKRHCYKPTCYICLTYDKGMFLILVGSVFLAFSLIIFVTEIDPTVLFPESIPDPERVIYFEHVPREADSSHIRQTDF